MLKLISVLKSQKQSLPLTFQTAFAGCFSKKMQMAMWAGYLQSKIRNAEQLSIPMSNLREKLLQVTSQQAVLRWKDKPTDQQLRQYEKYKLQAQRQIKARFDEDIVPEQPVYQRKFYNQERVTQGVHNNERLVFFPTYVTSSVFRIIAQQICHLLFCGQRGIGKTFSFMLYAQLNRFYMRAVDQFYQQNKKIPDIRYFNKEKVIYWTINISSNKHDQIFSQLYYQIIQQCPQIHEDIKTKAKDFFDVINNHDSDLQKCLKYLNSSCYEIKRVYKDKYNHRILLIVDQINVIASHYRKTAQLLKTKPSLQQFSQKQKLNYEKARIYDQIRLILDGMAQFVICNSSINIQRQFVAMDNYSPGKYVTQIGFGSKHSQFEFSSIDFPTIFESKDYVKMALKFLHFDLKRQSTKLDKSQNGINEEKKLSIETIYKHLSSESQIVRGCHLLVIRHAVKILIENYKKISAKQIIQAFKRAKMEDYQNMFKRFLDKIRRSLGEQQELTSHSLFKIAAKDPVKQYKLNIIHELKRHAIHNSQQELNINVTSHAQQYQTFIRDYVFDGELFYIKKHFSKSDGTYKYFLRSYLAAPYLSDIISKQLSQPSLFYKSIAELFNIQFEMKQKLGSIGGGQYELLMKKALLKAAKLSIVEKKAKGFKSEVYSLQKVALIPQFKNPPYSLQPIFNFANDLKLQETVLCIPTQNQKNSIIKIASEQKIQQQLKSKHSNSEAVDFILIKRNKNDVIEIKFVDITLQKKPLEKVTNFIKFLLKIRQMHLQDFLFNIEQKYEFTFYVFQITPKNEKVKLIKQAEKYIINNLRQNDIKGFLSEENTLIFVQNLQQSRANCKFVNLITDVEVLDYKNNYTGQFQQTKLYLDRYVAALKDSEQNKTKSS